MKPELEEIRIRRCCGETYGQIGKRFGVTGQTISTWLMRADRMNEHRRRFPRQEPMPVDEAYAVAVYYEWLSEFSQA